MVKRPVATFLRLSRKIKDLLFVIYLIPDSNCRQIPYGSDRPKSLHNEKVFKAACDESESLWHVRCSNILNRNFFTT
jgi:hypothetical protein